MLFQETKFKRIIIIPQVAYVFKIKLNYKRLCFWENLLLHSAICVPDLIYQFLRFSYNTKKSIKWNIKNGKWNNNTYLKNKLSPVPFKISLWPKIWRLLFNDFRNESSAVFFLTRDSCIAFRKYCQTVGKPLTDDLFV